MPQDPAQELRDLAAVHRFYLSTLEQALGHPVPVPQQVLEEDAVFIQTQRHWLDLLDIAIPPSMLRDALKRQESVEAAQAMLRYFVNKGSASSADLEKTDLVVTFLFRKTGPTVSGPTPLPPGAEGSGASVDQKPQFEEGILKILGVATVAPLAEEHAQLVREFHFVRQEVEDFRHFDELMDSGIIQRVRDIKHKLGVGLYHPRALATAAEYNAFFGKHFETLFRETAKEIKGFAAKVQQEGGSIMSRVDGDVIVKNLSEMQESALLQQDYSRALDEFHQVSKYKKAIDRRSGGVSHKPVPTNKPFAGMGPTPNKPPSESFQAAKPVGGPQATGATGLNDPMEETKVLGAQSTLRDFVRDHDGKAAYSFPVENTNIMLTMQEADAFRADYAGEKSFRGEYASAMMHAVALQARMVTEIFELKAKRHSAHLWKPHADSLQYLVSSAEHLAETGQKLAETAQARGLADKVSALKNCLEKLGVQRQIAQKALES